MSNPFNESPLAAPLPWDLVSSAYCEEITPQFETFSARALDLAGATAGHRLVDVACGPGTLTALALQRGCDVDALDFSPAMLSALRGRLGERDDLRLHCGDGQALPYPDAHFDAGFSMFGLIFFPDRVAGLRELRRVVKPGRPVVVSSWVPLDDAPALAVFFNALAAIAPKPAATTAEPAPPPPTPLGDDDAIRSEFGAAGFGDVAVHRVVHTMVAPDKATFFASMERTLAPLALMRHRMGDAWPAARERLHTLVMAGLGDGPVSFDMKALVTRAV